MKCLRGALIKGLLVKSHFPISKAPGALNTENAEYSSCIVYEAMTNNSMIGV